MESSTFWKVSILLTVVGCAYSGYQYYQHNLKVQEAKTEIQSLKLQIAEMHTFRDARKTDWEAYEALKVKAAAAAAKTAPLKQQKEELENKIKASVAAFKALVDSGGEAVEKVRANASSLVIPELKLSDGRVLKNAQIRKLEETQISFTHSDGIGTVPISLLPPETLERLDIGPNSLAGVITIAATDIFAGTSHAGGISLKCPFPLTEKPYPVKLPVVAEARQFEGGVADEMEVSVASIRYVPGTTINLDAAVAGTVKSISALPGMSSPKQQIKDLKVSDFTAKRLSFSAKRGGGEMFAESLFIYNGEKMWMIQVIYSNKTKGGSAIAESILSSVLVDSVP
ncbi:hypothetical protein [Prosthecobacter sp.]|uniref:hypothetical protein n=1 Tax=Prosthecobacter sp. TaxID=1965333 RepID=UPI00378352FD